MLFDIYISHYIDVENKNPEYQQWIQNFASFVEYYVGKLIKRQPKIITSKGLIQNDNISLNDVYQNTQIFIFVYSPEMIQSVQYQNEIQILSKNKRIQQLSFANIFKVFKYPIDETLIINELKFSFSYKFYTINTVTLEVTQFNDFYGYEEENAFWFGIIDLCYDIYNMIDNDPIQINRLDKKAIYLAEVSEDQYINRELIKRDLLMQGFKIFPEKHLDTGNTDNLEQLILQSLEKSEYSIHILGDEPGKPIESLKTNLVDFQNDIASEYNRNAAQQNNDKSFYRYIWIPPDLKYYNEKQLVTISQFKRNLKELYNAEIIETPLEIFRSIIKNHFQKEQNPTLGETIEANNRYNNTIYFIYEQKEKENTIIKTIIQYLHQKGFEVVLPEFEGDQRELIVLHKNRLVEANGVIIFYNDSATSWFRAKLQDILKSPGFGKTKPFGVKSVFIFNDKSNQINSFVSEDYSLLYYQNDDELKEQITSCLKPIEMLENV